jgi:hypothetical protein
MFKWKKGKFTRQVVHTNNFRKKFHYDIKINSDVYVVGLIYKFLSEVNFRLKF